MKKVAILSVKAGGGHMSAMYSLEKALKDFAPEIQTQCIVSKDESLEKTHIILMTRLTWIYRLGYFLSNFNFFGIVRVLKSLIPFKDQFWKDFEQVFLDEDVDVIISTHFMITEQILRMKRKYKSSKKIISYVPDFDLTRAHYPKVFGTEVDGIIAQNEIFLAKMHKKFGIHYKNLQKAGFLVSSEFSLSKDKLKEGKDNGLLNDYPEIDKDKFLIIVAGGSVWTDKITKKIETIYKKLNGSKDKVQFLVVTGGYKKGISSYKDLKEKGINVVIFDKLNHKQVAEAFSMSDMAILASLAPATMYELIEMNVMPIIVSRINPGQENYNLEYALGHKLVEWIQKPEYIADYIDSYINMQNFKNNKNDFFVKNYNKEKKKVINNAKETAEFIKSL